MSFSNDGSFLAQFQAMQKQQRGGAGAGAGSPAAPAGAGAAAAGGEGSTSAAAGGAVLSMPKAKPKPKPAVAAAFGQGDEEAEVAAPPADDIAASAKKAIENCAGWVAEHGEAFEQTLKTKNAGNPTFQFLFDSAPPARAAAFAPP